MGVKVTHMVAIQEEQDKILPQENLVTLMGTCTQEAVVEDLEVLHYQLKVVLEVEDQALLE